MPSAACLSASAFVSPDVCEGDELPVQCNRSLIVLDRSDVHSKTQDKTSRGSVSLPLSWSVIPFFGLICCLLVLVEACLCTCVQGWVCVCITDVLISCERWERNMRYIRKEGAKCEIVLLCECGASWVLHFAEGWSSLPVKEEEKYKFLISPSFLSTDPPFLLLLLLLLLHLLLLTPSSFLSLCLSSQQGGEARLTNWTKSEWIAEGQRRAWAGAMPVGRCSRQHNTRWRRLSSGVRPSRAKVASLIRSEVNGGTGLIKGGGRGKGGMRKREFTCLKSSEGGHVSPPPHYIWPVGMHTKIWLWLIAHGESHNTHITRSELQKKKRGGWSDRKHMQGKLNDTMTNV